MYEVLREIIELPEAEAYRELVRKVIDPAFNKALDNVEHVLCVSPHPDDCELSVGGTLASLVSKGKDVKLVVVSDGSLGTLDPSLSPQKLSETRYEEQIKASDVLGVKEVLWLGYSDGRVPYNDELRNKLVCLLRSLKPNIVFAPDPWCPYEAHPDHRNVGLLIAEAIIFSPLPHFSCSEAPGLEPWLVNYLALYNTSKPNTFYNITSFIEAKLNAIRLHKTQFEHDWEYYKSLILFNAAFYGKRASTLYAEAFKLLSTRLLHVFPVAEEI
ncbi:MAG: PIG-L deacetylase family protein [Zestosphaera sp.]